ncbi:immunoglobulin-like domain-containing protein [Eubacterium sp.]|uniref:immunoglobulin-like domain-containing protein n=1 Tax=Eubacterium sp. TaxID=142586 RepID=UPI0025DFCA5C|nr:immunoglobulin-like domain-containing protein [Eubacterium sp.]MCR5630058.1 hypothetical protein [Eubacterium sp.]
MKLLKGKRKIISMAMIVICALGIAGCGTKGDNKGVIDPEKMNKERTNLLENADIDHCLMEMMYYDGEKTEKRYVEVDKAKELYEEISNLKIKPIPLGKAREIKTPCFGISAGDKNKYGDIELTYYDGMWLRGTVKNVGTEDNIDLKYEYELYEADYDYKSAFDKYMMLDDEAKISKGGIKMYNAELLCNYNVEFYQEVDEEISSENKGISISGVDIKKNDEIDIKIKNEGNEIIDLFGWGIQKKVEDKWYNLPTYGMYVEADIGKCIFGSSEETFKKSIRKYGNLAAGKYRVVQEFNFNNDESDGEKEDSENLKVAREFDIK